MFLLVGKANKLSLKLQNDKAKVKLDHDWESAMNACLEGWHLPTQSEWEQLDDFLGVEESCKKMKSTYGWLYDGNGTNESGFDALP